MSGNSFGRNFVVTTFGESHGRALGCIVDGCPPGMSLTESDIQVDLDRRRPGQSRHTTQRQEPDQVQILSGVFEGVTTGTPIGLLIENTDQRSRDYGDIKDKFRPGHADYTYQQKYGIRDYRGGGRSSARETAMRVAAGAIARKYLREQAGRRDSRLPVAARADRTRRRRSRGCRPESVFLRRPGAPRRAGGVHGCPAQRRRFHRRKNQHSREQYSARPGRTRVRQAGGRDRARSDEYQCSQGCGARRRLCCGYPARQRAPR